MKKEEQQYLQQAARYYKLMSEDKNYINLILNRTPADEKKGVEKQNFEQHSTQLFIFISFQANLQLDKAIILLLLHQFQKQGYQKQTIDTIIQMKHIHPIITPFIIDWTELLNELFIFSFSVEQQVLLPTLKNKYKLLLIFDLMLCNNNTKKYEEVLQKKQTEDQCQCVSSYIFDITSKQQFTFIEYYETKFDLPFASEIYGIIVCFMTGFEVMKNSKTMNQNQILFIQSKNKEKVKTYFNFMGSLKKLIKKYRFCSYSIQKVIEDAFLGFHSIISIPNVEIASETELKKQKSEVVVFEKDQSFSKLTPQQPVIPMYKSLQEIQYKSSIIYEDKLKQLNEKQCSQEQFLNYLAYLEYQDKKFHQLLTELNNLGLRNQQIIKQLKECLVIHADHNINTLNHKIHLQSIKNQYIKKRDSIYGQKINMFGKSKNSATEEIQPYLKSIASLKSKQKSQGNYFTKMSQIFNLVPSESGEMEKDRFDKCPYLFYSKIQLKEGQIKEEENSEDEGNQKSQVKQSMKFTDLSYQEDSEKIERKSGSKSIESKNIFILAHGYQGSCGNMEKLKILMKKIFSKGKFLSLKSYTQCMDLSLQEMGLKAAKQILVFFNQIQSSNRKIKRVIMVGHSMGGIILRASLQHLDKKILKYLHTFISFATPHLGYLNCKNFVTGAGIQLIQSINCSISLKQLSNKDENDMKQTFIYKLASRGSLKQFHNIILFSSTQDKYVPWNSARIQLYKQPEGIGTKNSFGGWFMTSKKHSLRFVQLEMISQILGIGSKDSKVKGVHRFQVDFNINQINLDTVIGRTSHIAFLGNDHLIPMVFQQCLQKCLITQLKNETNRYL